MPVIAPYGTWKSPISSDSIVEDVVRPMYPVAAGEQVYWVEARPSEGGRIVLVRAGAGAGAGGVAVDVIPEGFNCRSLVHEYGGCCYVVQGDVVFFSNFSDQRIYRVDPGRPPVPITPEPPAPRSWRYGDTVVAPDGMHLVCIRERHEDGDVVNDLAVVPTDGSRPPETLVSGHDFFAAPVFSPDGGRMAWIAWDHPNMPWDGTELYEAEVGEGLKLGAPHLVAGGEHESVVDPAYSPDGTLHFVSDRTDWWNLYEDDGLGGTVLAPMAAEFAYPPWVFGLHRYGFLADGRIAASWRASGTDRLGIVSGGAAVEFDSPYSAIESLDVAGDRIVLVGGAADREREVASVVVRAGAATASEVSVIRSARQSRIDERFLSRPEPFEFPTEGGLTAHALFYPPRNDDFEAPEGETPPLIVMSHGGPTTAFYPVFDPQVQYMTSRGMGVVEVNYGGSTGFGRAYRERLKGAWGIVDLDDCVNAALALAAGGRADRSRLLVAGASAGGYTTLCAATFRDVFAAGSSLFGVADAAALARDTHKFESHYTDSLIGPWPEAEATYEERSPIFHTERLRTPLILFQGLEDVVVPPAQSETMAQALREKGVPFAYVAYEGEQHGFRQAANIKRTTEAALYFFGRVLGFEPADDIEPVEIENAEAIGSGARRG